MEKAFVQCGDTGLVNQLVYCMKCSAAAKHRYWMDVMPKTEDELVHWLCDECKEAELYRSRQRDQSPVLASYKSSSKNPKKNQRPKKSGGKKFSNSVAGSRGKKRMISKDNFKGLKSGEHAVKEKLAQLYGFYVHAEPLIRSVWTGSFIIYYQGSICRRMDGFSACLSSKACDKVREEVAEFQPVLPFEMLPKSYVWPKSFQRSRPTDDNVALYFFPSLTQHEGHYDCLVLEMLRDGLALRAFVQNAELLIFTSIELPPQFWRFQGKLYLWGVFRGKQAAHVNGPFFL